jgi:hypothetical protein
MDLPHEGVPDALRHTVRGAARGDVHLAAGHPAVDD